MHPGFAFARAGHPFQSSQLGRADPLSRLGRELQRLADTLSKRSSELRQLFDQVEKVEQGVLVEDILNRIFDGFNGLIPYNRISCAFLSADGTCLTAYWVRSELWSSRNCSGIFQADCGKQPRAGPEKRSPTHPQRSGKLSEGQAQSDATLSDREGRRAFKSDLPSDCRAPADRSSVLHKPAQKCISRRAPDDIPPNRKSGIGCHRQQPDLPAYHRTKPATDRGRQEALRDREPGCSDRRAQSWRDHAVGRARSGGCGPDTKVRSASSWRTSTISSRSTTAFGHVAGDTALKEFTRRSTRVIRQSDQLGRYGGEEFLIVAAGPLTHDTLAKAAERMRQSVVATPFDLGGESTNYFGELRCGHRNRRE